MAMLYRAEPIPGWRFVKWRCVGTLAPRNFAALLTMAVISTYFSSSWRVNVVYSQLINIMIHCSYLICVVYFIFQFLVQSTTSEPFSNHQSISLSSSAPLISPSGTSFPSAMRIQSSPSLPRGALNSFNSLRRRMRNGADGNTFTTLVRASTSVVDDGGLTAEKLALISMR